VSISKEYNALNVALLVHIYMMKLFIELLKYFAIVVVALSIGYIASTVYFDTSTDLYDIL